MPPTTATTTAHRKDQGLLSGFVASLQDGARLCKGMAHCSPKGVCSTDASGEGEVEGEVIPPTNEVMSLMMKAFTNMSSTSNDVLPNPDLADKLISVIKRKFKDGDVTLSSKTLALTCG
jgi:hypothetical protein